MDIGRRTGIVNDFDREILSVAEALVFTEQNLDWYQNSRLNRGSGLSLANLDPNLVGQLAGVEWRIVVPKEGAILIVEPSFRGTGGLPYTEPGTHEDVNVSVSPFPGGVLIWGNTPPEVKQVRLTTQNSVVLLATAVLGPDRRLFAVPIDDRLDPMSLELLDSDGNQIGSFELAHLVPHSIGAGIGPYTRPETSPDGD